VETPSLEHVGVMLDGKVATGTTAPTSY